MKHLLLCTGHELRYDNIVKAKNCTLYDDAGNEYLDLESGIWCSAVGHSHPRVTKTLTEQASNMMHAGYCYLNPVMETTSRKICRITGIPDGKCLYLCSGSEAVEFAVNIARAITDKPYVMTLNDSYLAAYGNAGAKDKEHWIQFEWRCNPRLERLPFDKIAAFVFEPGSSSGLVNFPPNEMIQTIIDNVRHNNGLIITNEVTTGIGRTGKWFGYNHYDITPDMVAIGKGLGNGYPVSCAVLSPTVFDRLDLSVFHYAQSHQNDPLGAAVAGEVIDIIEEENLLDAAKELGFYMKKRLNAIKEQHGIIKEVRGRGLMLAIEFEKADESYAERINRELLKEHIILVKRPGHEVFRLDPALTITREEIDRFLTTLESIIANL